MTGLVDDLAADFELEAEFRRSVRAFVDAVTPLSATRAFVDRGADPREAWRRAVGELRATALSVPEELGGQGAGLEFSGILFEEFGRSLAPVPLFGTAGLAVRVLAALGDSAADRLAPLLDGSETATVAWVGPRASWDPRDTAARVENGRVFGEFHHVVDGDSADTVLAVARDTDGLGVYAVARDADGLTATALKTLDLTRRLAHVRLDGVPAVRVGAGDQATAIRSGLFAAMALLAMESSGAARRAMEMSVDYARVRHQFGRPIGSFQAIKHKCADMLVRVELMSAIALDAVRAVGSRGLAAEEAVRSAKAYTSDAFFAVASETVQVHGGIGFTWEHDAHLFFRRAKASSLFFGDAAEQRAAIAAARGWSIPGEEP